MSDVIGTLASKILEKSRTGFGISAINAIILFLEKFLRIFASFLIGAWVIRYLGPEASGFISYTTAALAIFLAVTRLGMDQILLRDVTTKSNMLGDILGTALVLRFASGLLIFIVYVAYVLTTEDNAYAAGMICIMALVLLFQPLETFEIWFQGTGNIVKPVAARVTSLTILSCLRVFSILSGMGLVVFIVIQALDALIVGLLNFLFFRRSAKFKLSINVKIVKALMGEAWPLLLSAIVIIIYMRIDQIMIGMLLDHRSVGIFTAAINLQEAFYFVPTVIYTAFASKMTLEYVKNKEKYNAFTCLYLNFTTIYALVFTVVVYFSADFIINLIYGHQFAASADILRVYSFSFVFVCLGVSQNLWFINEGKGRYLLQKSIIGAVVNIAANFWLIPRFGPVGAAWSTVAAQFFATVGSNLLYARQLNSIQFILPFRFSYLRRIILNGGKVPETRSEP